MNISLSHVATALPLACPLTSARYGDVHGGYEGHFFVTVHLSFTVIRQDLAVQAIKQVIEHVAETHLCLPNLVVARVWSFAKPNL